MPELRQLSVIMFTDIAGYTTMMEQDEARAVFTLNRYKEMLMKEVRAFRGEIIQYFGDGGLVIFSNSADAVNCAIEIQLHFTKEIPIPVRIGLHLGDILVKEGNIFGDCVNVASRIEGMGTAGAVLVSELIQRQLRNKPGFRLVSLGRFEFKNVQEPMEVFAVAADHLVVPGREEINGKFKDDQSVKSIAVLPFVNMSNDPEQEYFGDGIAEEIINSLTHIKALNVAGRTSSFQFKGKNVDLREVGAKLSVRNVLEGSVRKQGNQLRITAQLIKVGDGYHLWSERYDREMNDVFAIQDEIALAITEKLRVSFVENDRKLLTKSYTQNTEAYELYLKGRFYLERRGSSLITARKYFQQAIDMDADFPLAYLGYADASLLLGTYGLMPPREVMPGAKLYAEKALELDPALCQPYYSLGYYFTCCEWNWEKGKMNFLKSLEINPRSAAGHFWYGYNYLACVEGKFDEAEEHARIAIELEPLSSICYAHHSLILHCAGKFEESLAAARMGIELDAHSFLCHINAGRTEMALDRNDDAIVSFEAALKLTRRHHFPLNALIWANCRKGNIETARELLNELKERSARGEYIAKTFTAFSMAYVGDVADAFDYLEQAFTDHDPILVMLKYERWIPPVMKDDPRFQVIMKRINFPE